MVEINWKEGLVFVLVVFFIWNFYYTIHTNSNDAVTDKNESIIIEEDPEIFEQEDRLSIDNFNSSKDLHWGHIPLKYRFNKLELCPNSSNKIRNAFKILFNESNNAVSFIEVNTSQEDIIIHCDTGAMDGTISTALSYTSTTNKNLLVYGELLYSREGWYKGECEKSEFPSLEIHEILHLFGFKHNPVKENGIPSIMYPYTEEHLSECDKITIDRYIIDKLNEIYLS